MSISVVELNHRAKNCTCGNKHYRINIEEMVVEAEALNKCAPFFLQKSFQKVALILDDNTYQVAGKTLEGFLEHANIQTSICLLEPNENGDVLADEEAIVQALLHIPNDIDVVVAVGSGTIHDITRFCSYKMTKPFVSVPTAPSVDGFTSMGAPLIVKGNKKTFQTLSPIAVFADLDVLKAAPTSMIAAGFGDMLAKYTSLADWKFGTLIGNEPYCPLVADLTKEALELCVANVDRIAQADEEGIKLLINGLLLSGLAMLLFGHSHCASGGEHHLSHYWEMDFLQRGRPQVLHGAKVGVATAVVSELYHEQLPNFLPFDGILLDNENKLIELLDSIPVAKDIRALLKKVSGPSIPTDLDIEEQLVNRSLKEAHHIRDRATILRYINEKCSLEAISN